MKPKQLLLGSAVLLLAACASDPVQFYTLVRPAEAPARPAADAPAFEVLPVQVPAQVDVPQMVVRESASEVALVENRQWIAPLGDEIRSALSGELAALGAQDVAGIPRRDLKVWRVKLEVRRFDSAPGHHVLIEGVWTLRSPQADKAAAVCNVNVQEPIGSGYAAVAEGHQRAIARIAAQIAASIKAAGGGAPSCP